MHTDPVSSIWKRKSLSIGNMLLLTILAREHLNLPSFSYLPIPRDQQLFSPCSPLPLRVLTRDLPVPGALLVVRQQRLLRPINKT
jgi:hypothetical protein